MTARCPSCYRTKVINVHAGVCNPCLLRAKAIARGRDPGRYFPSPHRLGDQVLAKLASLLKDQLPPPDKSYVVASSRSQNDPDPLDTPCVCEDDWDMRGSAP